MFNLCMFALRSIIKDNKIFLNNLTIDERPRKYERAADPIGRFLEEVLPEEAVESNVATKEVFYAAYEYYCKKYKLPKQSKINFGKILKQKFNLVEGREPTGDRRHVWRGVSLTEEYMKAVVGTQKTLSSETS